MNNKNIKQIDYQQNSKQNPKNGLIYSELDLILYFLLTVLFIFYYEEILYFNCCGRSGICCSGQ